MRTAKGRPLVTTSWPSPDTIIGWHDDDGLSWNEIAKRLGVRRFTVRRHLLERGYIPKPPIRTDISAWPSPEELLARNAEGDSWLAIAASLKVSRYKIYEYVTKKRAHSEPPSTVKAIKSNRAFLAAMREAISLGAECAIEGIKVDLTPMPATRFQAPDLPHSGCGSPGAMCLE